MSLHQVALKSRIISPHSRLLRPDSRPDVSSSSTSKYSASHGWSGSESEEEEYAATIRQISLRKLSQSHIPVTPRPKRLLPEDVAESRYSQLSNTSATSLSTSNSSCILTPSSSAHSMQPCERHGSISSHSGSFPWDGPFPSSPMIRIPGKEAKRLYEPLGSYPLIKMPRPRRDVEDWGAPEVLLVDGEWPSSSHAQLFKQSQREG